MNDPPAEQIPPEREMRWKGRGHFKPGLAVGRRWTLGESSSERHLALRAFGAELGRRVGLEYEFPRLDQLPPCEDRNLRVAVASVLGESRGDTNNCQSHRKDSDEHRSANHHDAPPS